MKIHKTQIKGFGCSKLAASLSLIALSVAIACSSTSIVPTGTSTLAEPTTVPVPETMATEQPDLIQTPVQSTPTTSPPAVPSTATPMPLPTSPPTSIPRPDINTSATLNADNSLVVDVMIELAEPAFAYVEYGSDDVGWFRTPTSAAQSIEHEIPIVRLRADSEYEYEAFAVDRIGQPLHSITGSFFTGTLPLSLASLVFTSEGETSRPIVIFDAETSVDDFWFALDQEGEIVWYWFPPLVDGKVPATSKRGLQGMKQKDDGNLVFISKGQGIFEIEPSGHVVQVLDTSNKSTLQEFEDVTVSGEDLGDVGPHHDMFLLDQNTVIYLDKDPRVIDDTASGGPKNLLVDGDRLLSWDLNTGEIQELWTVWDHISTDDRVKWRVRQRGAANRMWVDWTHANSIGVGPEGNTIISLRHLNQLVSISPDWQSVQWRLGGPGSDFTFENREDQFYHQHSATQLDNGNIVLFDNGNQRPRKEGGEYSRALELELDFTTMTAKKVWEFRPDPEVYAVAKSNAERLPNGNTLLGFGAPATDPLRTYEADQDGNQIWLHTFWSPTIIDRYRIQSFETLGGERRISR